MATGAVSSLGMGSGVLTSDVIDKLKTNDTNLVIAPIDKKIATNTQKQTSMTTLDSLATSLYGASSSLEDSTLYQKRTVAGSNDNVSVTADTGVAIQNFTISNTKMATTNVSQSGSFTSSTNTFATGSGKFNLNINGTDYKIAYDGTTTYDDLKTKINDIAGKDVTASILQTGDTSYSLILNSKTTGQAQQISLVDLSGTANNTLQSNNLVSGAFALSSSNISTGSGTFQLKDATGANIGSSFSYNASTSLSDLATMINSDPTASTSVSARIIQNDLGTYNLVLTPKAGASGPITLSNATGTALDTKLTTAATSTNSGGMTNIQAASDASFKYNGITLTRATNSITDLAVGLTINLLNNNTTTTANISVAQDAKPIKDAMQNLVDSYNTMSKQLTSMTQADVANNVVGLFNGDSSVNGIDRAIKQIITSMSSSGLSMTQYGIDVNQDGTLKFNSSAFDTKMKENPTAMAEYFSGKTTIDTNGNAKTTEGVFTTLYNNLKNLTKTNGVLDNLTNGLKTEATTLTTDKTKATAALNARYDTMTQQFIAYDAIISNLNNEFSTLSQQISMAVNGS